MHNRAFVNQIVALHWNEHLTNQLDESNAREGLSKGVLNHIYQQNWFKMFLPKALGGLECSLPEGVLLQESLGRLDGALGWTITLCSGANWFAGFVKSKDGLADLVSKEACWGGSGMVGGTAQQHKGGYLINGQWKFATGAPHLTAFTVNCQLLSSDATPLYVDGKPQVASFYLWPSEINLIYDWEAVGLKATASHSFAVVDRWVEEDRLFVLDESTVIRAEPIFKVPFQTFAEVTLVANYIGMSYQLFDLLYKDVMTNESHTHSNARRMIGDWKNTIDQLRTHFYYLIEQVWNDLKANHPLVAQQELEIHQACKKLVQICFQSIQDLFPTVGMSIIWSGHRVNKSWLDVMTASQHKLVRDLLIT
jgi:alkylation response protein AidB-like acyl-CoA dehydrogenase